MRVMYDLSILRHPHAGTARYAVELLRAMRKTAGFDVLVETAGWPRGPRGSRQWRLANAMVDIGWLSAGALGPAARHRIDAWYSPSNVLPFALPRPRIVTIHDTNFLASDTYDRRYAAYARLAFGASGRRATTVITVSHHASNRLTTELGIPSSRIVVAYPGIDHGTSIAPNEAGHSPRRPYALFVGQTEPHKNLVRLVAAWAVGVPSELGLVVVGPPGRDETRVREAIERSPARARITRLGAVDEGTLASLYRGATCFVFPSLAEGFGLPPLEAMRHGVPTAVADAASLPEVTAGAALTFDPLDPSAIADSVRRLVEDTELRTSLVARGREVAGRYRWDATARIVWQAIREAAT
jgi:glycosyltransferase involved in cell wall biosynthesis